MRDYLQRTEQFASYVYENPTILNKHRLALSDVVKMTQVLMPQLLVLSSKVHDIVWDGAGSGYARSYSN